MRNPGWLIVGLVLAGIIAITALFVLQALENGWL